MNATLVELGKVARFFGRYWRNETGMALNMRTEEPFHYGLKGSSDIIGMTTVEITPDMVGKKLGVFTGFEIKTGNAVQSQEQKNFETMVRDRGGFYYVVRSADDVIDYLAEATRLQRGAE